MPLHQMHDLHKYKPHSVVEAKSKVSDPRIIILIATNQECVAK